MAGYDADVVVVGGGPAGSTLAWDLARRGVSVVVLERACFPREKVCGDYVEPRGLEILRAMGCLEPIERARPLPITHTATYVDWERQYSGPIPFYGVNERVSPHGYTVARAELDAVMLDAAAREGASVHENASVATVSTSATGVELTVETARGSVRIRAKLIAGADGVNSVVAQSQGLTMDDPRRIAIARRAYASVAPAADRSGAADFFYEESSFPGYGWLFPARDGLVNIGVGLLAETRSRSRAHVPELFSRFVEQLRLHHPRCAELELVSKPIGGVVKMYGGAGPNHFDGGVLIGDAGCFVDPMTGEGITPGMESALIAAPVLLGALEAGDARAGRLAAFESAFRSYFDPSMLFLDFCAGMVRNQHFARPWLKGIARAYQVANSDPGFARLCGSYFGGLEVRPFDMMRLAWLRAMEEVALAWPRALSGARDPARAHGATSPSDLIEWQTALFRSLTRDPRWHFSWSVDLQRQWAKMRAAAARVDRDPRAEGLLFAGA